MSKPIIIDDSNFDQNVLQSDKPVLVDFWAPWCRPCIMVAPILDELAEEYKDRLIIATLDVDHNPKTAAKYNVPSLPTMIVFQNGQPVSNLVGLRRKAEMKQTLDDVLD